MNFIIRQFFPALLMIVLFGMPAISAEPGEPATQQTFPGASEILPRLATLKKQSSDLQNKLEILKEISYFEGPLLIAEQRATGLSREVEHLVSPSGRNYNRLLDIRSQLLEHQGNLDTLLNGISLRLKELDFLHRQWQERENFWQQWRQSIHSDLLKTQLEAFKEATQEIGKIREQIVAANKPLVGLQEKVVLLQEQNQVLLADVDSMLKIMRGKTFEKTSKSFTNPDFYRQFDRSLFVSVKKGIKGVSGIDEDFFHRQGWLMGLQLLLAISLAGFLLYRRYYD